MTVYEALPLAGCRCSDLHRRRRHADHGRKVQALPGHACPPASSGSTWSTCPRRSTTITRGSTSPSATSRPWRSWPSELHNLLTDGHSDRHLLPRPGDGPRGRLAGLRGGDRRRGEPGDRPGRHPRRHGNRPSRPSTRTPTSPRWTSSGKLLMRHIFDVKAWSNRIVDTVHGPRPRKEELRRDRDGRGPGRVPAANPRSASAFPSRSTRRSSPTRSATSPFRS